MERKRTKRRINLRIRPVSERLRYIQVVSAKTCEGCGLSNADYEKKPADPIGLPCRFCRRNAKAVKPVTDFHSETWFLTSNNTPSIEDPDPHEQNILRFLHQIVNEIEPQKEVEA